jgi:hypothetical protein
MAASTIERRKGDRIVFERGIPAHMMGIDGTWRRDCMMEDVSETGAKLTVQGSVEGLHLKEFFLLLSSTGLAYRRCELAWVNGDQIGSTPRPGRGLSLDLNLAWIWAVARPSYRATMA